MKDQILNYLSQGVSRRQICEIVGCTDSYISQVVAENREELETLREKQIDTRIKAKYSKLSEACLDTLKDSLSLLEPGQICRILETCQKGLTTAVPTVQNNFNFARVDLALPATVTKQELVINSQAEIVAFGKKSLAPMPSSKIQELFDNLKHKQQLANGIDSIEEEELEIIGESTDENGRSEVFVSTRSAH